ncbi:hypothetical protein ABG79_01285 [Caloramator mitchellensis]|uniref:Thiamine transporter HmpT n=1 Tax=Caloramator mitchellensis TaxID=908809 RepID=A0A0R3JUR4_CALMK|nr:ECF transporter S component [Caloramator mitchellensis]KRQ86794.1 hypothetical protein ABG79_01285 [Caloramator mitchellensis]
MQNNKLRKIIYSALGIAIVFIATIFIKIPYVKGYINFGDIFIFVIGSVFGSSVGMIAGGLGSALADVYLTYTIYAPATLVIKGIEGFVAAKLFQKFEAQNNKLMMYVSYFIAGIWMAFGYLIYETFLYGFATAVASVPGNLFQGIISAIVAIPLISMIKAVYKR